MPRRGAKKGSRRLNSLHPSPAHNAVTGSQTMSGGDKPELPFRLFDLPQELQDEIFSYAYPLTLNIRLRFKNDWDEDESERKKQDRAAYTARTFPPLKINEWLVTKRFFLAAASAWFSAQEFTSSARYSSQSATGSRFLGRNNGLYCTFATCTDVRMSSGMTNPMVKRLLFCQKLRTVILTIEENLCDLGERYGWEDELTDSELREILQETGLAALRGVKRVTVRPVYDAYWCRYTKTSKQLDMLNTNLTRLETLLAESAFQPRDDSIIHELGYHHLTHLVESYQTPTKLEYYPNTWRSLYMYSKVFPLSPEKLAKLTRKHGKKERERARKAVGKLASLQRVQKDKVERDHASEVVASPGKSAPKHQARPEREGIRKVAASHRKPATIEQEHKEKPEQDQGNVMGADPVRKAVIKGNAKWRWDIVLGGVCKVLKGMTWLYVALAMVLGTVQILGVLATALDICT